MDQRTDSHSNNSAHLRVVQYCLDYSGTVESIGEYIRVLEQYVSFRAAVEFFTVTVKMYKYAKFDQSIPCGSNYERFH